MVAISAIMLTLTTHSLSAISIYYNIFKSSLPLAVLVNKKGLIIKSLSRLALLDKQSVYRAVAEPFIKPL
jgi:hypothetical protein